MKYVYCLLLVGCATAMDPMDLDSAMSMTDTGTDVVVVVDTSTLDSDGDIPVDSEVPVEDSSVDSSVADTADSTPPPVDSGMADTRPPVVDSGCDAELLSRTDGFWCYDRLTLGPECFAGALGQAHCDFMQRIATDDVSDCYASCPSGGTIVINWTGTRHVVFCDVYSSC